MPNTAVPWRVPGQLSFASISVGGFNRCALGPAGLAHCWGANVRGEIGDGSDLAKLAPSAVAGGTQWRTVSAGLAHTCGITLDNRAYCWGNQFRGALGNGEVDGTTAQPVAVLGGLTLHDISAGAATSCALTPEGEAYCWGANDEGILGDGEPPAPFKRSATPIRVVGELRFASLAVGSTHVCGVTVDARAWCWGWNRYGQLGNGSTSSSSTPVPVVGDLKWMKLSLGEFHACGITIDGGTYCWGSNERGQLGDGTTSDSWVPKPVAGARTYIAVTAGARHTCGLTATGTAFCWGRGDYGQLGNGAFGDRLRAVPVASP